MEDGSRSRRSLVESLKGEWKLLWETLAGDLQNEEHSEEDLDHEKLEVMTLEKVRELTKSLSENRKSLNQKLEKLNKEIDLNAAKLESLQLVGSKDERTLKRMEDLTDQGQSMAESLQKLDLKLRSAHQLEEELRKNLASS